MRYELLKQSLTGELSLFAHLHEITRRRPMKGLGHWDRGKHTQHNELRLEMAGEGNSAREGTQRSRAEIGGK
jgi:hypothetical protein